MLSLPVLFLAIEVGCQTSTPPTIALPPPCECPPAAAAAGEGPPPRGDLGWLEIRDAYDGADVWRWQYPTWADEAIQAAGLDKTHDLRGASNPFLLNGDFDGDSKMDVAAWIVRRDNPDEISVVVVHRADNSVHRIHTGGPNWEVYPRQEVHPSVGEADAPPTLRGDALLFVKPESVSRLYFWDGSTYVGHQQGD